MIGRIPFWTIVLFNKSCYYKSKVTEKFHHHTNGIIDLKWGFQIDFGGSELMKKTVLVVEDEISIATLLKYNLEQAGFDVLLIQMLYLHYYLDIFL